MGKRIAIGGLKAETSGGPDPREWRFVLRPSRTRNVTRAVRNFFLDPEVQEIIQDSPRARKVMREFLDHDDGETAAASVK